MLVAQVLEVVNAMDAQSNLLNLKFDDFDLKLKEYAKENNVPIILANTVRHKKTKIIATIAIPTAIR